MARKPTSPSPEMIRAFVALNLPMGVLGDLAEVQKQLRQRAKQAGAELSWVPACNMHITLKFLGDIPVEASFAIRDRLQGLLASRAGFTLRVGGLGAFPASNRPRTLWAGVEDMATEGVISLAKEVDDTLEALGFAPETRAFHPHVTLARFKKSDASERFWEDVELPSAEVVGREVVLYRSELTRAGAEYASLARYELQLPPPSPAAEEAPVEEPQETTAEEALAEEAPAEEAPAEEAAAEEAPAEEAPAEEAPAEEAAAEEAPAEEAPAEEAAAEEAPAEEAAAEEASTEDTARDRESERTK